MSWLRRGYSRLLFRSLCSNNRNNTFREEWEHLPQQEQEWKRAGNTEKQGSLGERKPYPLKPFDLDTRWSLGSLNRAILIGYVGNDPVKREISSSTVAWMFPLSTAYKKRTGDQETITDWHNVTVYASPSAKFLDALIQKGNQLFLQGSIHNTIYVDQAGVKHKKCEIAVSMEGKGDLRLLNWSKKAIPGFRREGTTVSRNQKVEGPLEDFQPIKREK